MLDIIRAAHAAGVRGLMLSTHIRARDIAAALVADPVLSQDLRVYVLLPYMAKYVRVANQKGLLPMLADMLGGTGWSEKFSFALEAGAGVLKRDQFSMLESLIEMELLPFRGLNISAVFLHNALTDLVAALGLEDVAAFFIECIGRKFQAEPGFCTLSMVMASRFLGGMGVSNPLMMAPFNPLGFQMSPSRTECEASLTQFPARMIAMSVLAAGKVKPVEAADYLRGLGTIRSAVVGASSRMHVSESFEAIGAAFR